MPQPEALAEWGDGHCCPHFLLSGIKLPQHVTGLVTSDPWVWESKKNPNFRAGKDLSGPGWYLSGTGSSLPFTTLQAATVPEGSISLPSTHRLCLEQFRLPSLYAGSWRG